MTFYYSVHISFPLALHSRFLCVIFPPDGAVPLSVRVERERGRVRDWVGGREGGRRRATDRREEIDEEKRDRGTES